MEKSNLISSLPALIIFSFDYTLFPYNVTQELSTPITQLKNGKIIDYSGINHIHHYPEVPEILKKLKKMDIEIAVSVYQNEKHLADELLNIFKWNQYLSYVVTRYVWQDKTGHFLNRRIEWKIDFDEMILFDCDPLYIQSAKDLGILSTLIHPRRGMTMKILQDALEKYNQRQQKRDKNKLDKNQQEKN